MLDLRYFVVNKLPEDDIFVPKHVGVGNQYTVFYDLFYCVVTNAFCWLITVEPQYFAFN